MIGWRPMKILLTEGSWVAGGLGGLDIEAEMKDVAFFHEVVLAFQPQLAGLARARLALAGNIVVIGDGFGADEAMFEIGVDGARRLWGGGAGAHRPGAHFL